MGLRFGCFIHAGWKQEKQKHFYLNVPVQSSVSCIKDSNWAVGVQAFGFGTDIFPWGK